MDHSSQNDSAHRSFIRQRHIRGRLFEIISLLAVLAGLVMLILLFYDVARDGLPRLFGCQAAAGFPGFTCDLSVTEKFLTSFPSRRPEDAGILSPLVGSIYMVGLMIVFAFPIGIGAGIYLEEYAPRGWLTNLIQINIANLSGVPSIIYGLLGLQLFVRYLFNITGGRSVLSGSLTMALLVMPIIVIATREAIRAVPEEIRQASYALGATRWQTVWHHVLPYAMPGILTGTILAVSRAIGETAPLITIGALTYVAFLPEGITSAFTVLPIQIFNWVSRPQQGFADAAAAAIVVLLVILLTMNAAAILLRNRFDRKW
ncbi:MAG: phosphate ABC transporter permease PstA [Anaerolineae bacterium]